MVKKVKTPIYNFLKPLVLAALSASKYATGPLGWLVKFVTPKILDDLVRPWFVSWRINSKKSSRKGEVKETTDDLENAQTSDEIGTAFNNLK